MEKKPDPVSGSPIQCCHCFQSNRHHRCDQRHTDGFIPPEQGRQYAGMSQDKGYDIYQLKVKEPLVGTDNGSVDPQRKRDHEIHQKDEKYHFQLRRLIRGKSPVEYHLQIEIQNNPGNQGDQGNSCIQQQKHTVQSLLPRGILQRLTPGYIADHRLAESEIQNGKKRYG